MEIISFNNKFSELLETYLHENFHKLENNLVHMHPPVRFIVEHCLYCRLFGNIIYTADLETRLKKEDLNMEDELNLDHFQHLDNLDLDLDNLDLDNLEDLGLGDLYLGDLDNLEELGLGDLYLGDLDNLEDIDEALKLIQ